MGLARWQSSQRPMWLEQSGRWAREGGGDGGGGGWEGMGRSGRATGGRWRWEPRRAVGRGRTKFVWILSLDKRRHQHSIYPLISDWPFLFRSSSDPGLTPMKEGSGGEGSLCRWEDRGSEGGHGTSPRSHARLCQAGQGLRAALAPRRPPRSDDLGGYTPPPFFKTPVRFKGPGKPHSCSETRDARSP